MTNSPSQYISQRRGAKPVEIFAAFAAQVAAASAAVSLSLLLSSFEAALGLSSSSPASAAVSAQLLTVLPDTFGILV